MDVNQPGHPGPPLKSIIDRQNLGHIRNQDQLQIKHIRTMSVQLSATLAEPEISINKSRPLREYAPMGVPQIRRR